MAMERKGHRRGGSSGGYCSRLAVRGEAPRQRDARGRGQPATGRSLRHWSSGWSDCFRDFLGPVTWPAVGGARVL
jgi:hypothetical protein